MQKQTTNFKTNEKVNFSQEVKMMSISTMANYCGISKSTIASYVHYKQFPEDYKLYISIGTRKLFLLENVNKWLLDGAPLKKRPCKK